ncbi:MAG: hypothetical protein SPI14_06020 [Arcanobacterium sp.]|nr:hypothetical protein [Arcanobacterium sp.]
MMIRIRNTVTGTVAYVREGRVLGHEWVADTPTHARIPVKKREPARQKTIPESKKK